MGLRCSIPRAPHAIAIPKPSSTHHATSSVTSGDSMSSRPRPRPTPLRREPMISDWGPSSQGVVNFEARSTKPEYSKPTDQAAGCNTRFSVPNEVLCQNGSNLQAGILTPDGRTRGSVARGGRSRSPAFPIAKRARGRGSQAGRLGSQAKSSAPMKKGRD